MKIAKCKGLKRVTGLISKKSGICGISIFLYEIVVHKLIEEISNGYVGLALALPLVRFIHIEAHDN